MLRCEGYKDIGPNKYRGGGLHYCNGIIWPWQKRTNHLSKGEGWNFSTHVDHKTTREVMEELIDQPLLGEY